jgi:hypothetical protein
LRALKCLKGAEMRLALDQQVAMSH